MEILFLIFWGLWCLVRDFVAWIGRGFRQLGTGTRTQRLDTNKEPFNNTELLTFDILDDEE